MRIGQNGSLENLYDFIYAFKHCMYYKHGAIIFMRYKFMRSPLNKTLAEIYRFMVLGVVHVP